MRLSAASSVSLAALTAGIEWKQRLPNVLGKAGGVYGLVWTGHIPPVYRIVGSGGGGSCRVVFYGVDDNVPGLPSNSLNASRTKAGLIKNENIGEKESDACRCRKGRANRAQGADRHGRNESHVCGQKGNEQIEKEPCPSSADSTRPTCPRLPRLPGQPRRPLPSASGAAKSSARQPQATRMPVQAVSRLQSMRVTSVCSPWASLFATTATS